MKSAVYPGTFDPIHNGHIDLIERASMMFDRLYVVIAINSKKNNLFSEDERLDMVRGSLAHIENVDVVFHSSLLVNFAKEKGASALIRGLRTVSDFEYEMQIAMMNQKMSGISTIFLLPDLKYSYLNSSIIKEISKYNQNIEDFVPKEVAIRLEKKFTKD